MYLPKLRGGGRKAVKQTVQFGGINYTQAVQDGELESSRGVSTRLWPCLTTRLGRTEATKMRADSDIYAWDKLLLVDGTRLYYGGKDCGAVNPGRKQFAVVGNKLCIWPDKAYLDMESEKLVKMEAKVVNALRGEPVVLFTQDTLTLQSRGGVLETSEFYKTWGGQIDFLLQTFREEDLSWTPENGWTLGEVTVKGFMELVEGDCLLYPRSESGIRGSEKPQAVLNRDQFTTEYDQWGDYARIKAKPTWDVSVSGSSHFIIPLERRNAGDLNASLEGIFFPGDRVSVSGCTRQEENNRDKLEVKAVSGTSITFALGDNALFTPGEETGAVTLSREVPDLDFICESGGRLWGVSNKDGCVYASRGGDPTNFYAYITSSGATTDGSWTLGVGSQGDFTACVAYGSSVLCWKENTLHKILGSHAGNYELFTYQIPGVQVGSERSAQIINEVLYYKGRDGVYAYTGGTPRKLSGKLGLTDYGKAVAGQDGRSYLISMERRDTKTWETLRYDLETGLWMAEDAEEVSAFATVNGVLYSLRGETLYRHEGESDGYERIEWSATFAPFSTAIHNKKGLSRLLLYLELEKDSWVEVDLREDQGAYRTVWTAKAGDARAVVVPIRPGRSERFQLRLRGRGRFVLRSMVRELRVGGDWR